MSPPSESSLLTPAEVQDRGRVARHAPQRPQPGAHRSGTGRRARPSRHRRPPVTCCSKALPGLGKTELCKGARAPCSRCPSSACSSRPTCCPATSPAPTCSRARSATFVFRPGPLFASLVLADENQPLEPEDPIGTARGHAGTQRHRARYQPTPLPSPFFVLATQNPIELEGTYPAARGAARPVSCFAFRCRPVGAATMSKLLMQRVRGEAPAQAPVLDADGLRRLFAFSDRVQSASADRRLHRPPGPKRRMRRARARLQIPFAASSATGASPPRAALAMASSSRAPRRWPKASPTSASTKCATDRRDGGAQTTAWVLSYEAGLEKVTAERGGHGPASRRCPR